MSKIIDKKDITNDQIVGVISAINGAKGFLQRIEENQYMVIYNHEKDNNLNANIYNSKQKLAKALALSTITSFDTQQELFEWLIY